MVLLIVPSLRIPVQSYKAAIDFYTNCTPLDPLGNVVGVNISTKNCSFNQANSHPPAPEASARVWSFL
nr:BPK_HP1_G0043470.mRNA.1.CDS.1 [Saccharomyces cerevisiae]